MGRKVLEDYHGILNCNISPSFMLLGNFIDLTECIWPVKPLFFRVIMQSACKTYQTVLLPPIYIRIDKMYLLIFFSFMTHSVLVCFIAFNFH